MHPGRAFNDGLLPDLNLTRRHGSRIRMSRPKLRHHPYGAVARLNRRNSQNRMQKDFASPEDLRKEKISYLAMRYKIDPKTARVARQLALANDWGLIIGKN